MSVLPHRRLGDTAVSAIGLGALPFSTPAAGAVDQERAFATIFAAVDAGVTLIDTADAYAPRSSEVGYNERLVAAALAEHGDASHVVVATKGGATRSGEQDWGLDGRPDHLAAAARASAARLGRDAIDLYYIHRPDPEVPWADTVGALRDLIDDGIIQRAGLSNVNGAQITRAAEILGPDLVAVQNEFSPAHPGAVDEIELTKRLGVAFLPYSPLGGVPDAARLGTAHVSFQRVAEAHGVTAQQVCLAWQLAFAPHIIPIPGASRPTSIRSSAQAATLVLGPGEAAELSRSVGLDGLGTSATEGE